MGRVSVHRLLHTESDETARAWGIHGCVPRFMLVCDFADCELGMARRTVRLLARTITRVGVNGAHIRVRLTVGRTYVT